jgi:hypothetical protein
MLLTSVQTSTARIRSSSSHTCASYGLSPRGSLFCRGSARWLVQPAPITPDRVHATRGYKSCRRVLDNARPMRGPLRAPPGGESDENIKRLIRSGRSATDGRAARNHHPPRPSTGLRTRPSGAVSRPACPDQKRARPRQDYRRWSSWLPPDHSGGPSVWSAVIVPSPRRGASRIRGLRPTSSRAFRAAPVGRSPLPVLAGVPGQRARRAGPCRRCALCARGGRPGADPCTGAWQTSPG